MSVHIDTPSNHREEITATPKIAFILVVSLFFMWGLSHGLLDVLNKHFQDSLNVSKAQSGLVQAAYFGAYFLVALPVGAFMDRYGYKAGILVGLALFALGAILFVPAALIGTFAVFLGALFIMACGLGCLETAANLYAAVLGSPETTERRLNFSQSFNALGVFLGPMIGGTLFFAPSINLLGFSTDPVMFTYVCLALVVLLMMLVFAATPLPEVDVQSADLSFADATSSIWSFPNFTGAVIAQFFYIAAQVGIGAFFINYAVEHWSEASAQQASFLLSAGLLSFMVGRFVNTWLMQYFSARKMLIAYGLINAALCGVAVVGIDYVSVLALIGAFYFMSIMYPSIFAMGVKNLGSHTKKAGSILVMTLVGGAIAPYCMGVIADIYSTAVAFFIPLFCFLVIAVYGWRQPK
ncbi:L-fucose:H+ symporter permease [Pseudomonas putida]|uniref:L-fucose:H+ symporter permease n=1 Tax=Pseudomonas putida TaxID=303 RepID=UPI0023635CA8|nr:L-fucose:H+ symporter permease [Pseudomonas putida]MDD2001965.1 L-fucose:H+ symporter permease [Pseudomonas putida]